MITTINNCVGCSTLFGNCMGTACPYHEHKAVVCDNCENQEEHLYHYNGKVLCKECLWEELEADGVIEEVNQDEMLDEGEG